MDASCGFEGVTSCIEDGTAVFNVSGSDLCKFLLLIEKIEQGGYGGDQNIYKLRVDQSSRSEGTKPEKLLIVLKPHIRDKCVFQELRKYPLSEGTFGYKALTPADDHILDKFVNEMTNFPSFSNKETCCSQIFKTSRSPQLLVEHFFQMLESLAVETAPDRFLANSQHDEQNLIESAAQLKVDYLKLISSLEINELSSCEKKPVRKHCTCVDCFPMSDSESDSECELETDSRSKASTLPIPKRTISDESTLETRMKYPKYASGIQLDDNDYKVMITKSFSMSSIKSVLDLLPHRYAGLQIPYFHVGEQHSVFAAHIEDASLYAANYLHLGFPKVWITISPEFCERLRSVIQFLKMELSHTSCVNSLSHKFFFFTTRFLKYHCIPYHITVQHKYEMVILKPDTVHFGFNCGPCVAEAVNFATLTWIPKGFKSQQKWRCRCYQDSLIHVDVTHLVAAFYPHLLESPYNSSLNEIQKADVDVSQDLESDGKSGLENGACKDNTLKTNKSQQKVYKCQGPNCYAEFQGHRPRLLKHVKQKHSQDDVQGILLKIEQLYPTRTRISSSGLVCPVCSHVLSGSSTHLRIHFERQINNNTCDDTIRQKYVSALKVLDKTVRKRNRKQKKL